MEIEVGEYIRTRKNGIRKVNYINPRATVNKYKVKANGVDNEGDEYYITIKTTDIINHSFEPIDLIEIGDYVNGYRVVKIMENMQTGTIHLEMTSDYTNLEIGDCTIYNKDIKSIVTKEMMASMEYKVGGN